MRNRRFPLNIMTLLEQLSNNAHHKISPNDLINTQSDLIKKAFITNDSTFLKSLLGNVNNLADRDEVVRVIL